MFQQLEETIVNVLDEVIQSVVSVTTTRLARGYFNRIVPMQGQGLGVIISSYIYIKSTNKFFC